MGGGDPAAGGAVERWGVFGPRPLIQNSISDLGSDSTTAGNSFSSVENIKHAQTLVGYLLMKGPFKEIPQH